MRLSRKKLVSLCSVKTTLSLQCVRILSSFRNQPLSKNGSLMPVDGARGFGLSAIILFIAGRIDFIGSAVTRFLSQETDYPALNLNRRTYANNSMWLASRVPYGSRTH